MRLQLVVEGKDDRFCLKSLVAQHWNITAKGRLDSLLDIAEAGSKKDVKKVTKAILINPRCAIGLVIDGDKSVDASWKSVRAVLNDRVDNLPAHYPLDGFVSSLTVSGFSIGVWLMPGGGSQGELESLLLKAADVANPKLLEHATKSTRVARQLGAKFLPKHERKAVLHTWLAWQQEPGLPYGTAVKAGFLPPESPAFQPFFAWIDRLCPKDP
jgi:hypothetical protein